MLRNLLTELGATGVMTALALMAVPQHPAAAIAAVVVAWVGFQLSAGFAFMKALYHGHIVEHRTEPRSYSIAPHGHVGPLARRFMVSYLRIAKSRQSVPPAAIKRAR